MRRIALFLAITLIVGLAACVKPPADDGDIPHPRHGCSGSGGDVDPADAPAELWVVAVVCTIRMEAAGPVKPFTKRVRVIITAFDQLGVPGLWVDTPQNGPPVPQPYPKDTQEVTPYRHPIFFEPGLVITTSIAATLLGRQGEFIECWYEDMTGTEMVGTYNMAAVETVGENGNGATTVYCNTVVGE